MNPLRSPALAPEPLKVCYTLVMDHCFPVKDVVDISFGDGHVAIVKNNGNAYTVGNNNVGQLGYVTPQSCRLYCHCRQYGIPQTNGHLKA